MLIYLGGVQRVGLLVRLEQKVHRMFGSKMDVSFVIWDIDDGCLKTIHFDMMLLDLMGMLSMVMLKNLLVEVLC